MPRTFQNVCTRGHINSENSVSWWIHKRKSLYRGLFRTFAPQKDHTSPVLLWTDSCTLVFFYGCENVFSLPVQVRQEFLFFNGYWGCVCERVCVCMRARCWCEQSVPSIYIHTHRHTCTRAHNIYIYGEKLSPAYTHAHIKKYTWEQSVNIFFYFTREATQGRPL
jgi:hypothetical protein